MFNSKALKETPKRLMKPVCGCPDECDSECGFFGNILHTVGRFIMFKLFYPLKSFYDITKERIGRSYSYARFGWLNYDFDMACAWDLFEFKLKRLHKCLETGNSIQEPEDMAALKELIKVVRRLGRGNYDRKYYRRHDEKWGKIESRTEPWTNDKGKHMGSKWISWRTKCPENAPKKLKDKERRDTRTIWKNAEKDRVRDVKRMAEIIVKHGLRFWD